MSLTVKQHKKARLFDAISQFLNVLLLNGEANESISGRAFRCQWTRTERAINAVMFWEPDHCRWAYYTDLERANMLVSSAGITNRLKGAH